MIRARRESILLDTAGGHLMIKSAKSHRWGHAWNLLTVTLVLHVVDEARHDFLSFYNAISLNIREYLSWLPWPMFTYPVWIVTISTSIAILFGLSIFVYKGVGLMRYISYLYAVLMIVNGSAHIIMSIYNSSLIPGVMSSPLLQAAGVYLICSIPRHVWQSELEI